MTALDNIIEAFKREGYELYHVGGSVRDMVMGVIPKDRDFATNAHPKDIKELIHFHVSDLWNVGEKFGTIGAITTGVRGKLPIEITTYRKNEKYFDRSRKPDVVFGTSIYEDLSRRDFTMNAMAMNAYTGTLIDPFLGKNDIDNKLIRAVGDSDARMKEDPLRMLRAIRFASQLGFDITYDTSQGILNTRYNIAFVSLERISDELQKMLLTEKPSYAINELKAHDLLQLILPEISRLVGVQQNPAWHEFEVYEHTMRVLDETKADLRLRLAALFHDSGKYETYMKDMFGNIRFYNHEKHSAKRAGQALRRLKFPNDIRRAVMHICYMHMRPLHLMNTGYTRKSIRRFVRDCYKDGVTVEDVLLLNYADVKGHSSNSDMTEHMRLAYEVALEMDKSTTPIETAVSPLDGNDLMYLLVREPGPWVGEYKKYLTAMVIDGILAPDDREKAKEIIIECDRQRHGSKSSR